MNNNVTVRDVEILIDTIAPVKTAMSFDNVGLLVGDSNANITGILVALDVTRDVIKFASANNCNLIVCHHPVIYSKLASVTADSIVYDLIRAGISVIAAHTNLDLAVDGVNFALANALKLTELSPFVNQDNVGIVGRLPHTMSADTLASYIKEALCAPSVGYVGTADEINTVAVLGGAGEDYLYSSVVADAYITGEVPHHIYCYAQNAGISIFTAGHYHTEAVILPALRDRLQGCFAGVNIEIYDESGISFV